MTQKRFSTNGYYIYDHFHDGEKWLVNEVEAKDIVSVMNNLDIKSRERSKALSKLQKENKEFKQSIRVIYDLIDGYIAIADKYRKPIKSLSFGDDLGYWNGVYQYMKKLRERIGVL